MSYAVPAAAKSLVNPYELFCVPFLYAPKLPLAIPSAMPLARTLLPHAP